MTSLERFTEFLKSKGLYKGLRNSEIKELYNEWVISNQDNYRLEEYIVRSRYYCKIKRDNLNATYLSRQRDWDNTRPKREELAEKVIEYREIIIAEEIKEAEALVPEEEEEKKEDKITGINISNQHTETSTEIERILDTIFESKRDPEYIEDKFNKLYNKVKGLTDDIHYTLGLKYNLIKDKNINKDTRFTIHHRPNNNFIYFIYTERGEFKGILPLHRTWY